MRKILLIGQNPMIFKLAHKDAGKNKNLYIGHPEFEGFRVVV